MREMLQDFIERWRAIDFTNDEWRDDVHSLWESFSDDWELNPFLDKVETQNTYSSLFDYYHIRLETAVDEFRRAIGEMIVSISAIPPHLFEFTESSSRSAAKEVSDSIRD